MYLYRKATILFSIILNQNVLSYETTTTGYPYTTSRYPTSGYPTTTRYPYSTTTTGYPYTTTRYPTSGYPTTTTGYPYTTTTSRPTTVSPGGPCPDGWIDSIEGCFRLLYSANGLSWRQGQEQCEMLGGYLAEIKSEQQQNFLVSLALLEEELIGTQSWFIGLSDQGHEGRWIWQHSVTDVSYSSWGWGQPSNQNINDDCAIMNYNEDYSWSTLDCDAIDSRMSPICMRDVTGDYSTTTNYPTTTTNTYPSTTNSATRIELRGGNGYSSGNVYAVNRNGFFGPMCDDGLDSSTQAEEVQVICRQLGFSNGNGFCCSSFGSVSSSFSMDNVVCNGNEQYLQDCSYDTSENCSQGEGFGVDCYN